MSPVTRHASTASFDVIIVTVTEFRATKGARFVSLVCFAFVNLFVIPVAFYILEPQAMHEQARIIIAKSNLIMALLRLVQKGSQ